ncbi:MAG TPA: cation:proton antiporter [Bacteroidetes bacterium]|nr:cation:proton antiporter [Bacteroidota bacterium]
MILLSSPDITLPLTDPVLKFLIILLIILFTPIILNRLKIPPLLGLIVAGAVIGPHGFNLITRDSSIILSGTAGLLYIMFLAGLEIDLGQFRKNAGKSTFLGITGFLVPMVLGTVTGIYVLNYSVSTSVLMASLISSHTLITYPLVSKLGLVKNRAVTITVGSTLITDILVLLVLALIVGMSSGDMERYFIVKLLIAFVLFASVVMLVFPVLSRWFFKQTEDNILQYIFVLVLVFLAAVMSQLAGIEGIIGAFLAGLALNRLIPRTSPLMNRIEFVGHAIFIPFFLLGVGMLIDYRAFISDPETLVVALILTFIATVGKYIPAWITQKAFRFTHDQRRLIFGLSNARAAATLAAVLVGYNVILGHTADGGPIRLLGESILNGTIIMILITCTIASFETQKGAQNIVRDKSAGMEEAEPDERILIPVSNPDTVNELIHLSAMILSEKNHTGLYALNIIPNMEHPVETNMDEQARELLKKAAVTASSADIYLREILRYDLNIVNGITGVIREHNITDLVLGLHVSKGISESFLGNLTEGILEKSNVTTLVYQPVQPISTIKRHFVIMSRKAEKEPGFPFWILKIWNIARNTGTKILFYGRPSTLNIIRNIHAKHPIEAEFSHFDDWHDFMTLSRNVRLDDNLIIVMSRRNKPSYHPGMAAIPEYLNKHFRSNSFILIYPMQAGVAGGRESGLNNPSLLEPLEKLDELGKTLAGLLRKK